MNFHIVEDIKTISELKKKTKDVLAQAHQTGRPIIVTVNGKPDVVLMDAAVFEQRLNIANLKKLLSEGETDVAKGRVRSVKTVLGELNRHHANVSR